MALTAAQICTLAAQIAKCPGFTSQAGQFMNAVLQDLAQTYDFDINLTTTNFNFDTSASGRGYAIGSGPNVMPSGFLRVALNEAFYTISGVPYVMIGQKQADFDRLVQQAGLNSYPYAFFVDMSTTPPGLYIWPPAAGAYATTVRYYAQPTDITTPESSSTVPWFANQNYLITRIAGELMRITNDDRLQAYLGDGPTGAEGILRKYLMLKDDAETAVNTVTLDRRRWGSATDRLKNTKTIGW